MRPRADCGSEVVVVVEGRVVAGEDMLVGWAVRKECSPGGTAGWKSVDSEREKEVLDHLAVDTVGVRMEREVVGGEAAGAGG